jgi:hypothetical protein
MEQLNVDYIDQLADGNVEFRNKIISIIKKELPEEIEFYQTAIQNSKYIFAAECVHKLKHKISILGLEKSYYIAEEYEENLKQNTTNLQTDFEIILKRMQDFVDKL